jgi:hypothetical protein
MWYIRQSTGGSVDAKFIGVASIEKRLQQLVLFMDFNTFKNVCKMQDLA